MSYYLEMEDLNTQLQIAFLKSSEDHKLQLVDINGSVFAIIFAPLESLGPISLHCEEWSLVLLSPIKSKTNVLISGVNVICLNEISSEEGHVNIHATNKLIKFAHTSSGKTSEMGEKGEFQFSDDPGVFMQFYRLFEGVIKSVREGSDESLSQAQQKFIMSLCLLADKIEGNLDIRKVLEMWDIPF